MEIVIRHALLTALLGTPIGMVSIGCVDDNALGQRANVNVVMNGVTTQTGAVGFVLDPAAYDFVSTGTAGADSAEITVTVQDRDGVEVATVQFSLTLAEANASPGDTGSGSTKGVVVVPGVQSVSIDFRWQGITPAAEVGLEMSFFDNPDILAWTAEPTPPVEPATSVHVEVEATNNEGSQTEMTVSSQFLDASDGNVINSVGLVLDPDGLFKGDIEAPNYPGDHVLRIVATDNTGGVTQHERIHSVR